MEHQGEEVILYSSKLRNRSVKQFKLNTELREMTVPLLRPTPVIGSESCNENAYIIRGSGLALSFK